MSNDELLDRLHRIYAAIDEAVEGDLGKFPPTVVSTEKGFSMYQDFLGGLSGAQISNLAHTIIHNIANLDDHLKHWARKNGRDPVAIDQTVKSSPELQILKDLSNNDKHGYPPRDGGKSGKAPRLSDIGRVMRLTTAPQPGASIGMVLTPSGMKVVGSGSANVIVTGQVVDADGKAIGDLYDLALKAIAAWEAALQQLGLVK